jgi:hypothetical protein
VPFIRFTRDKRGYESTVVMHTYRPASGPQRNRVLYLFRSPSNLKLGRHAMDGEVMEALEHTHPDLAFDWMALQRDQGAARIEARERSRAAPPPPQRRPPVRPSQPAPEPTPAPVVEDHSLLGHTLGAEAAMRLRSRHNELIHRIARRARTPEERARLTERAARLNPDEWPDEAAIRASAEAFAAEWNAVVAELPQRRRGRRGGRHRQAERQGSDGAPVLSPEAGSLSGGEPALSGDDGDALEPEPADTSDPDDDPPTDL